MAFITDVNWGRRLTPEEKLLRDNKSDELKAAGLTDGIAVPEIGHRVWVTEQAAQDWIDFVNTFDPPPASAKVVTE